MQCVTHIVQPIRTGSDTIYMHCELKFDISKICVDLWLKTVSSEKKKCWEFNRVLQFLGKFIIPAKCMHISSQLGLRVAKL